MRKIHIISLFIIFSPIFLYAQNYTVKTFTTKDGLAHNNIRTIAEDSTGFLWIGTYDGLSRYDGYEFKNYYHIPGDTTSLSYFSVKKLLVDKNNNLWILTDRSEITLYNRITDNFKRILGFNDKSQNQIYNIGLDREGNLWVISHNEILRRDIETGVFTSFKIINKKGESISRENVFYDISFSGISTVWLIGPKIYEMEVTNSNLSEGSLILNKVFNLESSFLHGNMDFEVFSSFSFYESPTGNCWLFSNLGLFKLDDQKEAFSEYKGDVNENEFVGNSRFDWVRNKEGLFSYDQITHRSKIYMSEKCQYINAFQHHGKELLWVAGLSSTGEPTGLLQIVFTNSFFKNYLIKDIDSELPAVYSISKDQNNDLWLGIKGKDHIVRVTQNNRIKKTGQLTPDLFESSGHIRSMLQVKEGIWIGYMSNLLKFYDFKSGKFTRHFANENAFRTLALSKDGNIFIGNDNLSLYNPSTGKTELLWKSTGNWKIYDLFLDENNILWAGMSTNMLLKYNPVTKESSTYSISSESYHIEDICSGGKDDLWLATLGEGLCNFYPESGKTIYYTTSSGLSNNTTYCILKDKNGNIWISTDNGLSCLNPKTGQIRVYNTTDGVGIKEFNADASYEADDGEFFFGGMGGIVGFYPDSLPRTTEVIKSRILLTDFSVSGEEKALLKALNDLDTITLLKGENNFQLSFSSTDFLNSDKTIFRYKLNRVNNGWIGTNAHNRSVNYSNLKPGHYLFEIQSTNINGEWTADKKLVFNIVPYFYQTWLFRISVPLFIVFVLAGLIIVYIRQLKQKEKQKQDALKLQSLRGQMNPHFIFNSLNSINYFISNNDKLSANRYIADFSRLIRSILSNLGSDYVPFKNEVESIRDYLNIEHLRFGDKFDFELIVDLANDNTDFEIFPGLVQPFIENAIWHGVRALESRKGFVRVIFSSVESNRIRCSVEDDGVGWEASQVRKTNHENHKSRGINIVNERLQLISKLQGVNYHLEISDLYPDKKDAGTKVEIDIPAKSFKTDIK